MSGLLIGIDLGTTSAKAAVVSVDGRELAHGSVPMPWERVPTGAQLDPRLLPEVALAAASRALDLVPAGSVLAVGITSMAETGALLDGAGQPVAPAIAWHDARGEQEARDLAAALGAEEFTRRTGLALRPLCTIAKYRWIGEERARRWLNVAEWVAHALGGDQLAELSLSSRTGWLDIHGPRWWPEALEAAGAPADLLPPPVPAGTAFGKVTTGPERLLGAVLTVGGHDHHCGAVGVGAVDDGDVFDSSGTAEAFIAPVRPPVAPGEVARLAGFGVNVGWHAVAGRMALLGAQRAGLNLQRFLDLLGADVGALDAEAAALTDPGDVRVEGFEDDRAAVTGIGLSPRPAQVWRAAVEAMTRRSAEILGAIERGAGPTRRLVVGGGWARSATIRAAKAAALGPFDRPQVREPGCRGAALLAAVAAGLYTDVGSLPRPAGEE